MWGHISQHFFGMEICMQQSQLIGERTKESKKNLGKEKNQPPEFVRNRTIRNERIIFEQFLVTDNFIFFRLSNKF